MELPEKYLKQFIIKKRRKKQPTWRDINELNQAKLKTVDEIYTTGDSKDYFETTLEKECEVLKGK